MFTKFLFFTLLATYLEISTLECHSCGEVFDVDPCVEQNLVWDQNWNTLLPKCPRCGQEGTL